MNLSQINKIAFICNMAFALAMVMRFYPFLGGGAIESIVLIAGLILSPLTNLVVNLCNIRAYRKGRIFHMSKLFWFNLAIMLVQVFLVFSGSLSLGNTTP